MAIILGHGLPTKEPVQPKKNPTDRPEVQLSTENLAALLKSIGIAPKNLLSQNTHKNQNLLQLLHKVLEVLLTGLPNIV